VLPEIVDPDFEIELETITAMKSGSGPAGGGELLPGRRPEDQDDRRTSSLSSRRPRV
jgi:hypothetical protein